MREVARQSGVSIATVSRVFNGGPVNDDTRERVERVARSLRYVPNRAAQSLTTARTQTLGVVLPDLYGAFFSEVLRGLDLAAQRDGYHLLVSGSHDGPDGLAAALQAMSGRVDGLVVMSPHVDPAVIEANLPGTIPVVRLGVSEPGDWSACGVDNVAGARAMTEHLLALGHRRIAHLTGRPGNQDAHDRLCGYLAAMEAAGLATDGLVLEGDFTEASGHAAAQVWAAQATPPEAVFAANDAMAIGAMSALRDAGLRVPDDVAVAGFDDIPLGAYLQPALTSVHVPVDGMARQAVAALLGTIRAEGDLTSRTFVLPTRLVVRQSCGAAA